MKLGQSGFVEVTFEYIHWDIAVKLGQRLGRAFVSWFADVGLFEEELGS